MWGQLRALVGTFPRAARVKLIVYAVLQFFLSMLDLVGLAAILPVLQVLMGADPAVGEFAFFYRALGSPSSDSFVMILSLIIVAAFLLKAVFALATQWWSSGFLAELQVSTSTSLMRSFLSESYLRHRQRNTGEVIRTIGPAVSDALGRVLGGMLSLISSGLSILFVLSFLLVLMPIPTLAAVGYFGLVVFILQRVLADANHRAGVESQLTSWIVSHALVDSMAGFREIRMMDAERFYTDKYRTAAYTNAQAGRRANFLSSLPKNVLEVVTIIGIVVLITFALFADSAQGFVPLLSLFVVATMKILPTMVGLTSTLGSIRVGREGLKLTVQALAAQPDYQPLAELPSSADVTAERPGTIEITELSFRYPDGVRDVLQDVNLTIPPGSSIALCGSSGSGKTTLVDIILGLLPTDRGTVTYAGQPTSELGSAWHETVAYVPQDVYLVDDTLGGNVAFGTDPAERDTDRIRRCLERAQLGEVIDELPEGLDTLVGERGSRLSGGQRQRLGIARALYREPRIIVLDEATSALDNETENKVSQAIQSLRGEITTIIVAHRLSTVRHVDQLAFIERGLVTALGTFDHVRDTNSAFARLVELGSLDAHDPATDET